MPQVLLMRVPYSPFTHGINATVHTCSSCLCAMYLSLGPQHYHLSNIAGSRRSPWLRLSLMARSMTDGCRLSPASRWRTPWRGLDVEAGVRARVRMSPQSLLLLPEPRPLS